LILEGNFVTTSDPVKIRQIARFHQEKIKYQIYQLSRFSQVCSLIRDLNRVQSLRSRKRAIATGYDDARATDAGVVWVLTMYTKIQTVVLSIDHAWPKRPLRLESQHKLYG